MKKSLTRSFPDQVVDDVHKASKFFMDIYSWTEALQRYNGGQFIYTFLKNIKQHIKKENNRIIEIYGGHAWTLSPFVRALCLHDDFGTPDYGSAIIIETHSGKKGSYYIKVRTFKWNPSVCKFSRGAEILVNRQFPATPW